jgi:hypothetical protein
LGNLVFEKIRDLRGDAQNFSVEERRATAEWIWYHSRLFLPPVEGIEVLREEGWTGASTTRAILEVEGWSRYVMEHRRRNSSVEARRAQ